MCSFSLNQRSPLSHGGGGHHAVADKLVVVCLAHSWSPPALQTAAVASNLAGDLRSRAQIFCVAAEDEAEVCEQQLGIKVTPTTIAYCCGDPIPISRPDAPIQDRVVGCMNEDQFDELIHLCAEYGAGKGSGSSSRHITLDF